MDFFGGLTGEGGVPTVWEGTSPRQNSVILVLSLTTYPGHYGLGEFGGYTLVNITREDDVIALGSVMNWGWFVHTKALSFRYLLHAMILPICGEGARLWLQLVNLWSTYMKLL